MPRLRRLTAAATFPTPRIEAVRSRFSDREVLNRWLLSDEAEEWGQRNHASIAKSRSPRRESGLAWWKNAASVSEQTIPPPKPACSRSLLPMGRRRFAANAKRQRWAFRSYHFGILNRPITIKNETPPVHESNTPHSHPCARIVIKSQCGKAAWRSNKGQSGSDIAEHRHHLQ